MSLRFKNKINNNAIIGVWEIDPLILQSSVGLNLNETQQKRLNSFGTDRKKAEFLSVTRLLQNILDQESQIGRASCRERV